MLYQGKTRNYDSCSTCSNKFNFDDCLPITLDCTHTVCKECYHQLDNCTIDGSLIEKAIDLPYNIPLLHSTGYGDEISEKVNSGLDRALTAYKGASSYGIEMFHKLNTSLIKFACLLRNSNSKESHTIEQKRDNDDNLSNQMERKIQTLMHTQPMTENGRKRTNNCLISIYERLITELVNVQFSNKSMESRFRNLLSTRKRCHLPDPKVQRKFIKHLWNVMSHEENGNERTPFERKTLVQHLKLQFQTKVTKNIERRIPSGTIARMVQLIYSFDCFEIIPSDPTEKEKCNRLRLKRTLTSLEEFRHHYDVNMIKLATDKKIRISPDYWSKLLYGEDTKNSKMQSILDKIQNRPSLCELEQIVIKNGDPYRVVPILPKLKKIEKRAEMAKQDSSIEITCKIAKSLLKLRSYMTVKRSKKLKAPVDKG